MKTTIQKKMSGQKLAPDSKWKWRVPEQWNVLVCKDGRQLLTDGTIGLLNVWQIRKGN